MKTRIMKTQTEMWFDGFNPFYGLKVIIFAGLMLIVMQLFTKEIEVCEKCNKSLSKKVKP